MDKQLHKNILRGPKYKVFEKVAAELAVTWYEVGRGQGLTSKWKDPISYARANFEKFLPKAIEYCISMLDRQDIPDLAKAEMYEALMERNNDPNIIKITGLPNIDITKLLPKQDRIQGEISTVLHNKTKPFNPYLKVN